MRAALRLILIFILAYTGVTIWYNRLEQDMLASVPVEKAVEKVSVAGKKPAIERVSDNYDVIIKRNIFGAALEKKEEQVVSAPVEELKPTKLKLSLMGTVSGTSGSSRAIISDDTSRKQDIYAVGDTVQGAVIKSIERRRVVLMVNGKNEVLDIKDREGGPAETAFTPPGPVPTVRKSLRDRLNARRPIVRPSPRNRQVPVSTRPSPEEDVGQDNADVPDENSEEFVDQEPEQLDETTDTIDQDQEQLEEPGLDNQQ